MAENLSSIKVYIPSNKSIKINFWVVASENAQYFTPTLPSEGLAYWLPLAVHHRLNLTRYLCFQPQRIATFCIIFARKPQKAQDGGPRVQRERWISITNDTADTPISGPHSPGPWRSSEISRVLCLSCIEQLVWERKLRQGREERINFIIWQKKQVSWTIQTIVWCSIFLTWSICSQNPKVIEHVQPSNLSSWIESLASLKSQDVSSICVRLLVVGKKDLSIATVLHRTPRWH